MVMEDLVKRTMAPLAMEYGILCTTSSHGCPFFMISSHPSNSLSVAINCFYNQGSTLAENIRYLNTYVQI